MVCVKFNFCFDFKLDSFCLILLLRDIQVSAEVKVLVALQEVGVSLGLRFVLFLASNQIDVLLCYI